MTAAAPCSSSARRPVPVLGIVSLAILLVACRGSGPGASVTPSAASSAAGSSAVATASQSAAATASGQPSASPTDDLGAFTCDLPVRGDASVSRAQLVDVRVGTHPGYDRVVFEFDDGVPAFTLKRATPPLLEDASGRQLDVDGNAFWRLAMRPASRADLDGNTSLATTDFHPRFAKLTELVEGGDFEAVSSWYFGLDARSCVRVLTLRNSSRLVFDIEH